MKFSKEQRSKYMGEVFTSERTMHRQLTGTMSI